MVRDQGDRPERHRSSSPRTVSPWPYTRMVTEAGLSMRSATRNGGPLPCGLSRMLVGGGARDPRGGERRRDRVAKMAPPPLLAPGFRARPRARAPPLQIVDEMA